MNLRKAPEGCIGLMGHVIADYPSPEAARTMIRVMAESGVEVIEIQIPFSEPMADGPIFRAANHQALKQGVRYQQCLDLMSEASQQHPNICFLFMCYLNTAFRRGAGFSREASDAGAQGVIIPDLPFELASRFLNADLPLVPIIAPNTRQERRDHILESTSSLVYCVSRPGVTGGGVRLTESTRQYLEQVRRQARGPVAVGFGIRQGGDVEAIISLADYAIIGTASLEIWREQGEKQFCNYWQAMRASAQNKG